MVDIITILEGLQEIEYLNISYRYKFLDYLVSDKYGNLFILQHCPHKRTIPFKQLEPFRDGKYKSIKYHQRNISFIQLKDLAYKVIQKIML